MGFSHSIGNPVWDFRAATDARIRSGRSGWPGDLYSVQRESVMIFIALKSGTKP